MCSGTCGERRRRGASRLLPVSSSRFGDRGGAVVSPALLHAPPPLRLPLPVDENLRGAQLLQELLLDVLRFNPRLLLLPAREHATFVTDLQRSVTAAMGFITDSYLELVGSGFFRPCSWYEPS